MSERRVLFVCLALCAASAAACTESSSTNDKSCSASFKDVCTSEISYDTCINETIYSVKCAEGSFCKDGFCQNSTKCSDSEPPECVGTDAYKVCKNGVYTTEKCESGTQCTNGVCQTKTSCSDSEPPECVGTDAYKVCKNGVYTTEKCESGTQCIKGVCQASECSSTSSVCKDDNTAVVCIDGMLQEKHCPNGCRNNACAEEASQCGNQIIDADEVCDGTNLGTMTCYDVADAKPNSGYTGKPACNSTCTGVENGTCKPTQCGNNYVEADYGEICDLVDGWPKFNVPHECTDYLKKPDGTDYEWVEGGRPGCSADCKNFSKGTCKLAPQAIGGIAECQFISLAPNDTAKIASASAIVKTEEGIESDKIVGKLVCMSHKDDNTEQTYKWSLSSMAEDAECLVCGDNEKRLAADISYAAWGGGLYDCAFLVNAEGGSGSWYMCSNEQGYPIPQEMAPDETQYQQFAVTKTAPEGTVLASWRFSNYQKGDEIQTASADGGVYSAASSLTLSDNSIIPMLVGLGGYPEAAASTNNMAIASSFNASYKHFVFKTSSAGYKNIRVQFAVSGSGHNEKHITAAFKSGDMTVKVGEELVFDDDKSVFKTFPLTVLDGADNLKTLEFLVYPYTPDGDANSTIRLDDVYILGDSE